MLAVRDVGAARARPGDRRRLRALNLVAVGAAVTSVGYLTFYLAMDAATFAPVIAVICVTAPLYLAALLFSARGAIGWGIACAVAVGIVQLGAISWLLGAGAGVQNWLLIVPPIYCLLAREGEYAPAVALSLVVGAIVAVIGLRAPPGIFAGLPEAVGASIYFGSIVAATLFVTLIALFFRWNIARAEAGLREERARADALLRAILPDPVAERLKADRSDRAADRIEAATVMFADIVGFTAAAARRDPGEVVAELNRVFAALDDLAAARGVERIKTMGDAVLCVAGAPAPAADHAARVADLALDIRDLAGDWRSPLFPRLRFRIAAHSGPLAAGVVGRTRFAYDVWGDAVNAAARLEERCAADEILVTADTAALLPPRFRLAPAGEADLRGVGVHALFRLLGRDAGGD